MFWMIIEGLQGNRRQTVLFSFFHSVIQNRAGMDSMFETNLIFSITPGKTLTKGQAFLNWWNGSGQDMLPQHESEEHTLEHYINFQHNFLATMAQAKLVFINSGENTWQKQNSVSTVTFIHLLIHSANIQTLTS